MRFIGEPMKNFWPFTANFFIYAAFAIVVPFFVLYFQELGFSGEEIGIIAGFTPLVTTISGPFWTNLADRTRKYHLILGFLFASAILVLTVFPFFNLFMIVFLLLILFNLFVGPFVSFIDTSTMHMLGDRKDQYGRVRLGGTFGFGFAAALAGGMVEKYGMPSAFWVSAAFFGMAFMVTRKLRFAGQEKTDEIEPRANILSLLREPRWAVLLAVAFVSGIGFAASSTYFYPYMAGLGARESLMGIAVLVGTLAEVPVLFFGGWFFKLFRPFTLLILATAMTGLRLILLALINSPELVLVVQLMNGLTFVLMWTAGVAYADKHAPRNMKATVQGLFGAMNFGIGSAVGGFIGGPILVSVGGNGLFMLYGIIVLAFGAAAWVVGERLNGKKAVAVLRLGD